MRRRLVYGFSAVAAIASLATAQQVGTIRGVVIDKDYDAPLAGAREVAFFPPMTGG